MSNPSKATRLLNKPGEALERKVRVPKRTGKLQRETSYRLVRARGKFPLKGQFGSKPKYATYVNEGTTAHVIRPKKKNGVLAWADAMTGKMAFAKEVHHPGSRPNPYLGEAAYNVFGFDHVRRNRSF